MNRTLIETQARHQIAERVALASAPHLARVGSLVGPRRRLASGVRPFADRLER